ncbi:MAG: M20 family metallopeptidase, partial [Acidimicrobiia bacterium]|nr:M20 family metallopeptidase [Acidimicrobiia bacterium]
MTLKDRAQDQFTAVETELRDVSRWMYDNPEIAWEERDTSARLASFLGDKGFAVDYPAYDLDTAFVARTGTSGPEVVICAEYDALPEVGHACGHNVIATAAIGAGVALQGIADELGIRVTVLGTPAEEAYGGKVDLINAGAFSEAAASMMIHPSPMDVLDPDVLAVAHIDVEFHGKESHAAFAPQVGINALDAAVQAYVNVSTLRQAMYPTDKVHGVITYGGGAPNVVPALTKMSWYVRASTQERLRELHDKVVACFDGAARATGCTFEVKESGHTYEDLKSDKVLAELYQANSTALGRPLTRGADMDSSASGSTDMGNVSHVVPSIHPFLGINSLPAVNHQKEFAAHTVTP